MAKTTIYDVLADNVRAGMVNKYSKENQTRLVRDSKIGTGTISRILGTEDQPRGTSVGVEVLEKIGSALGVPAWALLFPKAASLFHDKNIQKFLEVCHSWAEADDDGRDMMLTAAKIARAQKNASQGERPATSLARDAR